MSDKVIARLTIRGASEMTHEGRNEIAKWLRRQSDLLRREGDNYSEEFTARFLVPADENSSKDSPGSRASKAGGPKRQQAA